MDKKELQEKIVEYYKKLPPVAQKFFASMEWMEILERISIKYSLENKQKETLGVETTLVLLGIVHEEDYRNILLNELNMPGELGNKLVDEVDNLILKTYRRELTETFLKNNEEAGVKVRVQSEKFGNLPESTKEVVLESDYQEKVYEIARENGLTISQTGILGECVFQILNGLVSSAEFETSLKKLNLPIEKTAKIAQETNEKIFGVVRKTLLKKSEERDNEETNNNDEETETLETREEMLRHIENPIPTQKIEVQDKIPDKKIEVQSIKLDDQEIMAPEKPEEVEEEKSLLDQKLSQTLKSTSKESDHSTQNVSTPSNKNGQKQIGNSDPYRMPIE